MYSNVSPSTGKKPIVLRIPRLLRSSRGRELHLREPGPPGIDELLTTPSFRKICAREHEVGRRRAGGQLAREFHADHLGHEHETAAAEHVGLRFDAADAPAQHAQAR